MIDRTLDKLRALPGSQSAAITSVMPLTGDMSIDGLVRPDNPVPEGQVPMANRRFISPGYFGTMGISSSPGGTSMNRIARIHGLSSFLKRRPRPRWPERIPWATPPALGAHLYRGWHCRGRTNQRSETRRSLSSTCPTGISLLQARCSLCAVRRPSRRLGPEMRQAIWSIDPEISIPTIDFIDRPGE